MKLELVAKLLLMFGSAKYIMTSGESFKYVVLLAVVYLGFNRDFYLPFLGKCVFPVTEKAQNTSDRIQVVVKKMPPNVRVLYWAAKPSTDTFANPFIAYDDYANMGTATTNSNGEATFSVQCPGKYYVGKWKKEIPPHVHYRYELPPHKGMFSRVYTTSLKC